MLMLLIQRHISTGFLDIASGLYLYIDTLFWCSLKMILLIHQHCFAGFLYIVSGLCRDIITFYILCRYINIFPLVCLILFQVYVDASMLSILVTLDVDSDDTSTFSDWLSRGCFRFMLIHKHSLSFLAKLEVDFVDMSNFSAGFLEAVLGYVNNTLFW